MRNKIQLNFLNFSLKLQKKIENTAFYFFSEGETIQSLKRLNKNENIFFFDLVNKENLEELYRKSFIQIIPQKENTSKGSLPSKLPNLLASGCRVLVITDPKSEIEMFFRDNNLDLVVTNWDMEILIEKLALLISKKVDEQHQKEIARKTFTIDKMILKVFR